MTIEQLTAQEEAVLFQINDTVGTIEERSQQLRTMGVFDAYQNIHCQYAKLATLNLEALKRALFLQWYGLVEPSYYSGISVINPQAEETVIQALESQVKQPVMEAELQAMLSYYLNWEAIFDRYERSKLFNRLITDRLDYKAIIDQISSYSMHKRGQMGLYWQSII